MMSDTELYTLADLLARQPDDYYSKFGIEQVEQPYFQDDLWVTVCERFNTQYYECFINGETLEQWQIRLQGITDRLLPRLHRIHNLQTIYSIDDLEIGLQSETSAKTSSSSNSSSRDTEYPDSAPRDLSAYGGSESESTSSGSDSRTGSTRTTSTVLGGKTVEIAESMRYWHDITTEIVDGYRPAFLSVIYY